MMKENRSLLVLGLLLLLLFAYGLLQLFLLRADQGDIYPYYSSLRSDPLGSKAFYEALEECCGDVEVRRNFLPFSRIRNEVDSVVLVLGMDVSALSSVPESVAGDVDSFIREGGRLVLVFLPVLDRPLLPEKAFKEAVEEKSERQLLEFVSLHEKWGITPAYQDQESGWDAPASRASPLRMQKGPDHVSVHTRLFFDSLEPGWEVVYARKNDAVVTERKMGKGSLVYSALSYFVSNEALLKERHPGLLAWMIGSKRRVIFDEYHHGIYESPGTAFLIRKYEMHWLVLAMILLSLLFIWRELSPFPPFSEVSGISSFGYAGGKDTASGLRNLLQRNIPERDLFRVCLEEWKHCHRYLVAPGRNPNWIRRQELDLYSRIQHAVKGDPASQKEKRDPVEEYNSVVRMIKKTGR